MKRLAILLLILSPALAPAAPYGGWENATYVSVRVSYDGLSHCLYRSYSGYEFEIAVRGACPATIVVQPSTGATQF